VGTLGESASEEDLMAGIAASFGVKSLRHSKFTGKPVSKVAVCGGAGIFLLRDALSRGADVFITSDVKYHDFFDADGRILLVDMGHFESEQFTIELLFDILRRNFPNFAILKTGINTNPVHYFG
jgi:putative NIF3 family GTP cyclohydrolase 1 type 2